MQVCKSVDSPYVTQCDHSVEPGLDTCVFHASIEEKRKNPELVKKFYEGFKQLLNEKDYDFAGFVFPDDMDISNIDFTLAQPSENLSRPVYPDFSAATFGNIVRFTKSKFPEHTSFVGADFLGSSYWRGASFGSLIEFGETTWRGRAVFRNVTFGNLLEFSFSKFLNMAEFGGSTFGPDAKFTRALFGTCTFAKCVFKGSVDFEEAIFSKGADFSYIDFFGEAAFNGSYFYGKVGFYRSTFHEKAYFDQVAGPINTPMNEEESKNIDQLKGGPFVGSPPWLVFNDTKFNKHSSFRRVNLCNTRFQDTNLNNVSLLDSQLGDTIFVGVGWGDGVENSKYTTRETRKWYKFKRDNLLYDELLKRREKNDVIDPAYIKPNNKISTATILAIALQLKNSLEKNRDPITAGDFHFCVMEMKREQAKEEGKKGRKRILWLYKMANGYGERYGRTLMWLGWLVAIFTGLYAWNGNFVPAEWTCREVDAALKNGQAGPAANGFWEYLLFALQNILPFKFGQPILNPCSLGAKALSFAETFIGSSLFAFFLLALRRRFKR